MTRPSFILLGSCRADILGQALRRVPLLAERFEIVYYRSYKHPLFGWEQVQPEVFGRCAVLWEEIGQWESFPFKEALALDTQTLTFPSVDFSCLWPNRCKDPLNRPEPPAFPDGRFPFGDARLIALMKGTTDRQTILAGCAALDSGWERALDRLVQLETHRILANDAKCDIKIGQFILEQFREVRTHYTYNHPTPALLHALLFQLTEATDFGAGLRFNEIYRVIRDVFNTWDPLDTYRVAVHPLVAERLGLTWQPEARYGNARDEVLTFQEYFDRYLTWRLAAG